MATTAPALDVLTEALRSAIPDLNEEERTLALAVYRTLAKGHPATPSELSVITGQTIDHLNDTLTSWPGVFRNEAGDVFGFWGLALFGMPHQLNTGTATITTWCALDPFLIAPLLDVAESTVTSTDPVTGEQVTLTITANGVQEISPANAVVSMLTPDGQFGPDVVQSFCHYVHFFASPESGQQWADDNPGTFLLSVSDTNKVARGAWPAVFRNHDTSEAAR